MVDKTREEKTLTARQIAERYGVARSTVRGWLLRQILPGARLVESGLGDSYWVVPESALKDFTPPKPGPVPKVDKAAPGSNGKVFVKKSAKTGKGK